MLIESLPLSEQIKKIFVEHDGIKELYPPQDEAITHGLLEGKNLVISIPTASGKTLLAELAILKHVIENGGKAIYLCPLRALASEKFNEFKRFSNLGVKVTVTSGDYDSHDSYLSRYDIIVSTNEKMDALLRHRASWITEQVSLVIIDECHLINDQHRGPTLETLLARLIIENPQAQLIALSATVGNADELAEWLDAELVRSSWRPVPLKEGIYFQDQVLYDDYSTREIAYKRKDPIINIALDSIHSQEQMLVFTPSRKSAVTTAEKLGKIAEPLIKPRDNKKLEELSSQAVTNLSDPLSVKLAETIKKGVAFHHAGLNSQQREIVEKGFKQGYIKLICSTPTLAAGINIPAKRVVISSVYRYSFEEGSHPIKTLEYKQMCLPENTPVLSPTSDVPIQSLIEGDKILSCTPDGKLVSDEVVKRFERISEELIEIQTSLGIELTGTAEHPIWTPSGWRVLGELKSGDKIAYLNQIKRKKKSIHMIELLPEENVYIPNASWIFKEVKQKKGWGNHRLSSYLGVKNPGNIFGYKKGTKATKLAWVYKLLDLLNYSKEKKYSCIKIVKSRYGNPFKVGWLSPELMWLIGIIATDGNIKVNNNSRTGSFTATIRIYNTNIKILERAKSILNSFSIDVNIKKAHNPKLNSIEFGNTLFAYILHKCGIPYGKKGYDVYVPDFFYSLDNDLLWAYISGVFDGDGNLAILEDRYRYRISFSTSSKRYAFGLHQLLLHLNILSTIHPRTVDRKQIDIKEKPTQFNRENYIVIFRKKEDIIKFRENGTITKCKIPKIEYSTYNEVYKRGKTELPYDFIKIERIKRINGKSKVFNVQTKRTNAYIANNFLVHNCGRAGRPQFDTEGESILLAKEERVVHWLMERYILRDAEAVYSKLAAKPALRRNILGLIASQVVMTVSGLLQFFEKTFYGFQFEAVLLEGKIREVIDLLIVWEMINPLDANETLQATPYGLRVAQLYLDPETAATLAEGLQNAIQFPRVKTHPTALLDLIVGTPDMVELSFRRQDEKKTEERLKKFAPKLINRVPDLYDIEYEFRLRDFKTVLFLWDWISEMPIEKIVMKYGIGSGDIRRVVDTATWLVSALVEISELKRRKDNRYRIYAKKAKSLSERVTYGIKKDAVSLTQVKGIGRKRARVLLEHGIRDLAQLSSKNILELSKIPGIGTELAKTILEAASTATLEEKQEGEAYLNGDITKFMS